MKKAKVLTALDELQKLADLYKQEAKELYSTSPYDQRHRIAQASGIEISIKKLKVLLNLEPGLVEEPEYGTTDYVMKKAYELAVQQLQNYRTLVK